MTNRFKALTVAGTDPSGGAGIQADLKTFQELGVYGMSVVTAVVSQNTMGVRTFTNMSLDLIESQMDAVFDDIRPNAVKTGMLSRPETIELVVRKIREHEAPAVVVDPVMVAKSGDPLLAGEARETMIQTLLPVAHVVTPNLPEAVAITGRTIKTKEDMKDAAKRIVEEFGATAAVVKGGHLEKEAYDILYDGSGFEAFTTERFPTKHTHGTGCTFSSAIAAELAKGTPLPEAVQTAKTFITAAISHPIALGRGNGPVNHWAYNERGV